MTCGRSRSRTARSSGTCGSIRCGATRSCSTRTRRRCATRCCGWMRCGSSGRGGARSARAERLCAGASVVPVPWEACADKGREIGAVLRRSTPAVEQASSDEFYLDLSGTERLYHDEPLATTAGRIREAVLADTTLSLSIGGATSKLVAKLAAGVAKPRPGAPSAGVHVVPPGAEGEFMLRFALGDLPSIGPKSQ